MAAIGRPSNYEHLKDTAIERLRSGVSPWRVSQDLGIPKSTVYDWKKSITDTSGSTSGTVSINGSKGDRGETPPSSVTPLEPLEGGQSDIDWVKSGLRSAIRRADTVGVKVQGYNAYLRALEVEHRIGSDRSGLSNADRMRRLDQILKTARTRRTRPPAD